MIMNRIVLLFFSVAILGMYSCNKPEGDNILTFEFVPAIIGYDYEMSQYTLITSGETLLVPELKFFNLFEWGVWEGDAVFAFFSVNYDDQPFEGYITVTELNHLESLEPSTFAEQTDDIPDDFNAFIESIESIIRIDSGDRFVIFSYLLFNFVNMDREFEYIMTYEPIEEEVTPTVTIRAKVIETGSQPVWDYIFVHTFDLTHFIMELKLNNKNEFNIRYKHGEQGEQEIFRNWIGNPVRIE